MKKSLLLLVLFASIFIGGTMQAQTVQIGLNWYNPFLLGDISNSDFTNKNSGYVTFATGTNIEFKYFTKGNFGFGLRTSYTSYAKDITAYREDLMSALGVSDSNLVMQSLYSYRYFGGLVGVSYVFIISIRFNIEPYMYIGFGAFTSPLEEVTYFKNNETYIQKKPLTAFATFNYTPGVNFQWNIVNGHLGIRLYAEYDGFSMEEWGEERLTYSATSFNKSSALKTYDIQAFNIGLGVSYRFGKSFKE
jgi:hypothetical protein